MTAITVLFASAVASFAADPPPDKNQTEAGGFTGPTTLTVKSGDLSIRFDGLKLWTPSGIVYKDHRFAVEDSAYGTVFNLENVGFIGSAHREVETEQILSVRFFQDGQPVMGRPTSLAAKSFRCERHSRVRDLELNSVVELRDGRWHETARVRAHKDVRLHKAYHFMHAWTPNATHFLYGQDDKVLVAGELKNTPEDDRKFHTHATANWVGVFDAATGLGAVSRLQEHPKAGHTSMQIWNVPEVYRKFYLVTFVDETIPAGFDGTYRMTTEFFSAETKTWPATAVGIAQELGRAVKPK